MRDLKKVKLFFKNNYLLILILVLAAFFRFYQINSIPPGLYPDIAMNGTDAIHAIETGGYKLFYPANNGREGVFINFIAMSFKIFGVGLWQLRITGATVGLLTVLGIYFLTKEIFNKKTALFASLICASSFWAVSISRIGFRASMVPLLIAWGFYTLFKAIKSNKAIYWLLSGLIFGLGFHTYISYKVVPLVFALVLLAYIFLKKGFLWENWKRMAIFSVAFVIVIAPIILYQLKHSADFARTGQVSIFSSEVNKGHFVKELTITTAKALGMFNFYGDPNWRHNYSGFPLLNPLVGIAFLIGVYLLLKLIVKSIKSNKYEEAIIFSYLIILLGAMMLPTILAPEGAPHALRAIGVLPAAIIISAYGYSGFSDWLEKKKVKFGKYILIGIFTIIVIFDFVLYFILWANNREVHWSFSENLTNMGYYINRLPKDTVKYVIVNERGSIVEDVPVSAQTVKFITYKKSDVTYLNPEDVKNLTIDFGKRNVFLIMTYDDRVKQELQAKYYGKWEEIYSDTGYDTNFYIYNVY